MTDGGKGARILQLTDCHLGEASDFTLAGIDTGRSLREVLAQVRADQPVADMVMVTGDIAAEGNLPAYERFTLEMERLGLPYAWLPGNHDNFQVMQEGMQSAPYWPLLDIGRWRLISLNTAVPGRPQGRLEQEELRFLETALKREPERPAAIFMHHPPCPVGCAWLDRQRVTNSDELEGIIRAAGNVRLICTGHVHQAVTTEFAGAALLSTPSTCFQFAAGSDDFAIAGDPPAYRWLDLHGDGSFDTGVVSIRESTQKPDTGMRGY